MMVVTAVLLMFAALVTPNVVSMQKASARRAAYADVRRLAERARVEAINSGRTTLLSYEDATGTMNLEQEVPADQSDPRAVPAAASEPETQPIARALLPSGVVGSGFQLQGKSTASGEWKLHFYPDGKSDGGGIEMTEGSTVRSLSVKSDGTISMGEGSLTETASQSWPAGDYVRRS